MPTTLRHTRSSLSSLASLLALFVVHAWSQSAAAAVGWCATSDVVDKYVHFGDRRWEEPGAGVNVVLAQDESAGLPLAAQVAAIVSATGAWNDVACSAMRLRYVGVVASDSAARDNTIVVRFSDELLDEPRVVLAYTDVNEVDEDGFFVNSSIVLNSRAFVWRDDACAGGPDLAGVVAHELGHALGLAHSDVRPSIMANPWPAEDTWQLRALRPDDVAAICALYPCSGDSCGPAAPEAGCERCSDDEACGDDFCINGVCAWFCADDEACGDGFRCELATLADRCEGRCLADPGVCEPAPELVGQQCAADAECGAPIGVCDGAQGICALLCDGDFECGDDRCVSATDAAGAPVSLCRARPKKPETCSAAALRPSGVVTWFALLGAGWYRRRRARLAVDSPGRL